MFEKGSSTKARLGAVAAILFFVSTVMAGAQPATMFVEGKNVGIGTATPTVRLDLRGSDGLTQLRVQESSTTPASRTGLMLINNGGIRLGYLDTSTGVLWAFNNLGAKFIANSGGLPNELVLDTSGNLTITGSLTTASSTVPDYVFAPDYELMPIHELAAFLDENRHLPNLPSAEEIEAKGQIDMTDFQMRLLEKVEELTLYTIEQQQRIDSLQSQNGALMERLQDLESSLGAVPASRDD